MGRSPLVEMSNEVSAFGTRKVNEESIFSRRSSRKMKPKRNIDEGVFNINIAESAIEATLRDQLDQQIKLVATIEKECTSFKESTLQNAQTRLSEIQKMYNVVQGRNASGNPMNPSESLVRVKNELEIEEKRFIELKIQRKCHRESKSLAKKIFFLQNRLINLKKELALCQRVCEMYALDHQKNSLRYTALKAPYIFMEEDSPENIVFDFQVGSTDFPLIKGGSLNKLVERLTYDEYYDLSFLRQFLLTYKSFTTSMQLLEMLIARYNFPSVVDSVEKKEEFKMFIVMPVQLRVLNVLKNWVDKHHEDFMSIDGVPYKIYNILTNFISSIIEAADKKQTHLVQQCETILRILLKRRQSTLKGKSENLRKQFSEKPPVPLLPSREITDLLQLDSLELARQMTLLEFELYTCVSADDMASLACGITNQASFSKLSHHFNKMSQYVTKTVVTEAVLKERRNIICKWIRVAEYCLDLHNFNGVFEVVSGLQASAVDRLKLTWAIIPSDMMTKMKHVSGIVDQLHNFSTYRKALQTASQPCLPYIGVYLTDLTFIRDSNPNYLADHKSLINFSKRRRISALLLEMQQFSNTPYCLERVDVVINLMESEALAVGNEDSNYEESLKREPRASDHSCKRISFVIGAEGRNSKSSKVWDKISSKVDEYFLTQWSSVSATPKNMKTTTKELMQAGFNTIIAVGGDNIISEMVNAYLENDGLGLNCVIGIIPTGDSISKLLGIPSDPLEALRTIYEDQTTQMDVGKVQCVDSNGDEKESFFINSCSFGAPSTKRKSWSKINKKLLGGSSSNPLDASSTGHSTSTNRNVSYQFYDGKSVLNDEVVDDQMTNVKTVSMYRMAVCNSKTLGGGLEIAPGASISDGLLDIVIMKDSEEFLDISKPQRRGSLKKADTLRVRTLKVEACPDFDSDKLFLVKEEPIVVSVDGNPLGCLPATFSVAESAVTIFVPKFSENAMVLRRSKSIFRESRQGRLSLKDFPQKCLQSESSSMHRSFSEPSLNYSNLRHSFSTPNLTLLADLSCNIDNEELNNKRKKSLNAVKINFDNIIFDEGSLDGRLQTSYKFSLENFASIV